MVALLQHLHERRGGGVEFHRVEQLEVGLGAAAPDEGMEEAVRGFRAAGKDGLECVVVLEVFKVVGGFTGVA